ncbi:hypothetical protein AVEN_174046-1 [Araneus ventricosus]|uniref:Uncharacterized protein n=1 Tax=Araneus ventricosus TaxID=182803 RepID=A0A4Y2C3N2_ARAVE|nr:hypothetical protein AVEN_174046-1 [Araneus ventricosus]
MLSFVPTRWNKAWGFIIFRNATSRTAATMHTQSEEARRNCIEVSARRLGGLRCPNINRHFNGTVEPHKKKPLTNNEFLRSYDKRFVMNNTAAENALSASDDVVANVFKASPSFIVFDDRFSVESNYCNSCSPILIKLDPFLLQQRKITVFEWITLSNFSYNVQDFSSKVSCLSSECKKLDSDSPLSQKALL